MKSLLVAVFSILSLQTFCQINPEDSTAQIIGFWDRGEKQSYMVSFEKLDIKGADTTSRSMTKYDVDITVIDSTTNTYTVEWLYKNFQTNNDNPLVKKIVESGNNMKVLIKTDEFGAVQEVVNWMEVRDYMKKMIGTLRKEFKNVSKIDEILQQIEAQFTTKEAIESSAIKDAQQFYSFHGAKYKLGEELKVNLKAPNVLGGEPFDSELVVSLDEMNVEDNNVVLRTSQTVNPQQLMDATFNYMVTLAKKLGKPAPTQEDLKELKELKNETLVASRIHGSGWPIYTVQTITIETGGNTNVQERIIEIKD